VAIIVVVALIVAVAITCRCGYYLSLATDCSGRVGEFLDTYGKRKKPTFLCWRHVTITAFRTPAGVTLRGTIRFENLKDSNSDLNKHKTIPLRLLPLELASEDSFRLLLVLGLIDQVFKGLYNWEDIQRLDPGPNGSKVCIKTSDIGLQNYSYYCRCGSYCRCGYYLSLWLSFFLLSAIITLLIFT
jgi:hypothetical protein